MHATLLTLDRTTAAARTTEWFATSSNENSRGFQTSLKDAMTPSDLAAPSSNASQATSEKPAEGSAGKTSSNESAHNQAQGSTDEAQSLPEPDAASPDQHEADESSNEEVSELHVASPLVPMPIAADDQNDADRARHDGQHQSAKDDRGRETVTRHTEIGGPQAAARTKAANQQPVTETKPEGGSVPVQATNLEPSEASPQRQSDNQPQFRIETFDIEPRGGERVEPAVARVAQIETAIRLENATGQTGVTADASTRPGHALMQGGAAVNGGGVNSGGEQANGHTLPSTLDEERFSGRIVRGLTAIINQRGGSMTMRLDPPELGQLRIQMTIARGVVTAQFTASTAQAHALLDKNLANLRVALENQGLTVDRLNVQSNQSSSQNQSMNEHNADKQHQQHNAGHGHSRGRRDDAPEHQSTGSDRSFARMIAGAEMEGEDHEHNR